MNNATAPETITQKELHGIRRLHHWRRMLGLVFFPLTLVVVLAGILTRDVQDSTALAVFMASVLIAQLFILVRFTFTLRCPRCECWLTPMVSKCAECHLDLKLPARPAAGNGSNRGLL